MRPAAALPFRPRTLGAGQRNQTEGELRHLGQVEGRQIRHAQAQGHAAEQHAEGDPEPLHPTVARWVAPLQNEGRHQAAGHEYHPEEHGHLPLHEAPVSVAGWANRWAA